MSADAEVYCPRCFRIAPKDQVFCSFCGQFVHANVTPDSRAWDSRTPDLTNSGPEETQPPVAFNIPESDHHYGSSRSPTNESELASLPSDETPDGNDESD